MALTSVGPREKSQPILEQSGRNRQTNKAPASLPQQAQPLNSGPPNRLLPALTPKQAASAAPASSPSEDEGRKLIYVLRPFHFSQSNYLHLSISLQIRTHSAGLTNLDACLAPPHPQPAHSWPSQPPSPTSSQGYGVLTTVGIPHALH